MEAMGNFMTKWMKTGKSSNSNSKSQQTPKPLATMARHDNNIVALYVAHHVMHYWKAQCHSIVMRNGHFVYLS